MLYTRVTLEPKVIGSCDQGVRRLTVVSPAGLGVPTIEYRESNT